MARELTPQEQVAEIKAEFMVHAAKFERERRADQREMLGNYINALLDTYLDMWPLLIEPGHSAPLNPGRSVGGVELS